MSIAIQDVVDFPAAPRRTTTSTMSETALGEADATSSRPVSAVNPRLNNTNSNNNNNNETQNENENTTGEGGEDGRQLDIPALANRHPLTKKMVVDACLKNGFYRTPSCNERLYLHFLGVDSLGCDHDDNRWPDSVYQDQETEQENENENDDEKENNEEQDEQQDENQQQEDQQEQQQSRETAGGGAASSAPPLHTADNPPDAALAEYTDCLCVWLEGNCLASLRGIQYVPRTRSLYAHQNMLKRLTHLERLTRLDSLNVSDNYIDFLSGLDAQANTLSNLQIKNNRLKTKESYAHLATLKNLRSLDLSNNAIESGEDLIEILQQMPALRSLYLSGNPLVRDTRNYRRTILAALPELLHLDEKPVFDDERRCVTAWARGGAAAEREEKKAIREEEQAECLRRLNDFRALVRDARRDARQANAAATDANLLAAAAAARQQNNSNEELGNDEDGHPIENSAPRRIPANNRLDVRNENENDEESATSSESEDDEENDDEEGNSNKFCNSEIPPNIPMENGSSKSARKRVLSTNVGGAAPSSSSSSLATASTRAAGAPAAEQQQQDDDDNTTAAGGGAASRGAGGGNSFLTELQTDRQQRQQHVDPMRQQQQQERAVEVQRQQQQEEDENLEDVYMG